MRAYREKLEAKIRELIGDAQVDENRLTAMMLNTNELTTDMGTVLDGDMAVECGLIDNIGSLSDALAKLYQMTDEHETEK